jgi:hypothetical protein
LSTFASNTIPKSKSSTATTNRTSFTRIITIVQERKYNLPKWIWQQTNEIVEKKDLNKNTLEKTQVCKKHQYKMKI